MLVQLDSCIYKNAIRYRSITFAKLKSIKSLWGSAPTKPLNQWVSGMLPNHFGTSRKSLTFTQIYIWKKNKRIKINNDTFVPFRMLIFPLLKKRRIFVSPPEDTEKKRIWQGRNTLLESESMLEQTSLQFTEAHLPLPPSAGIKGICHHLPVPAMFWISCSVNLLYI